MAGSLLHTAQSNLRASNPPAHEPEDLSRCCPVALSDLWQHFWIARNQEDRNDLVLFYKALVHTVVTRLPFDVRTHSDLDDLESFGMLGLIDAVQRFEENSQVSLFPVYAKTRIRGAIYDELRKIDWLPRSIRRRVTDYHIVVDDLSGALGRAPMKSEVLGSLGIKANKENALLQQVDSSQLTHFHQGETDEEWSSGYRNIDQLVADPDDSPESQLMATERIADLRTAVAHLPERQRTVITLHCFGDLTQAQIGAMLSVSTSRVSQIQAAAISALRVMLEDQEEQVATGA